MFNDKISVNMNFNDTNDKIDIKTNNLEDKKTEEDSYSQFDSLFQIPKVFIVAKENSVAQ